jgi:cell wall assembly regulator SMI1
LSEQQLDAVAAKLSVSLPLELRQLWAWHDGADPSSRSDIGPGGYEFLTTQEVIAEHRSNREVHPKSWAEEMGAPDMYWHASWIPFMTQGPQRLYVDADRGSWRSPIRRVSWEWEDFDVDIAPSLAAAVSMWTWLLASDYYGWDGRTGEPVDYTAIPLFARWTFA